jgi:ketosteroid isomerase-like protein
MSMNELGDVMSTDTDQRQILDLLTAYTEAVDQGDWEGYADLFAKGVVKLPNGMTLTGRDEALRYPTGNVYLYDGSPRTHHFVQNPRVTIDADGQTAHVSSYAQVLQEVPPDFPLQTIATARYLDTMRRDEDGWYFAERVIEQVLLGDTSRHTRNQRGRADTR